MNSGWVEASAGTGKTTVLVNRVLVLLVTGSSGVFCLTFTNAAANEMLNRISNRLRRWVMLAKCDLQSELELLGVRCNDALLNYSRSLFYRLKNLVSIKTIHGFCYELITSFAHEAKLPYDIKVLEYREGLYYQVIDAFLRENRNLGEISVQLSKKKLFDIFEQLLPVIKDYHIYVQCLRHIKDELVVVNKPDNSAIISKMILGSTRDVKYAELLKSGNESKVFLSSDGSMKKISSIVTQVLLKKFPDLETLVLSAQENFCLWYRTQGKLKVLAETEGILEISYKLNKIFNELKGNYITYNEIIDLTVELLRSPDYHGVIMLSLSDKIQHILIDEAQDNSPQQWEIIRILTEDFFSGIGPGNTQRTIFAVGDCKQSIYSFQGANPELFPLMKSYFTEQASFFHHKLISRSINTSYRSTTQILELVDRIFNTQHILQSVSPYTEKIEHVCADQNTEGSVEIWPLIDGDDCKLLLAEKIAHKILSLTNDIEVNSTKQITPSDVMVLVRHRDIFIHHLHAALKKQGVKVAGYDRFNITDHIIVKDLISLGKVLLDPNNSFELMKVLKSPLFSLKDDDIFSICTVRGEKSILEQLNIYHPWIVKQIKSLQQFNSPFDLYYKIISERGLMQLYHEILDKFLSLAWDIPILSEFLQFLEMNKIEVKNLSSDGVRIMTVHSAKGLEARMVFLADTTVLPKARGDILFNKEMVPFYLKGENFNDIKENNNRGIYQEYLRLLYVALTRAKERIYVTGCGKAQNGSWYNIICTQ